MIPTGVTRIIWAIAPNEGLRDAMLGDFQEEYDALAASAGQRAARRWCWRQALRSLAGTLRRSFPPPAALGISVLPAMVWGFLVYECGVLAFGLTFRALATPFWLAISPIVGGMNANIAIMVASTPLLGLVAMMGGYEAARVGRRAPLWSAVLTGLVATVFDAGANLAAATQAHLPVHALPWLAPLLLLVVPCMLAGGVLQQAQQRRLAAAFTLY